MHSTKQPIILGLDPGTRFLGVAVLRGQKLLAYAVHELRNGNHAFEVIDQARRVVFGCIAAYSPDTVAIEAPYAIATERGAVLRTLAKELHDRAEELGLAVVELTPEHVRQLVAANPRATKIDVASALIERGFAELRHLTPKRPVRSGLGLRPRDRYWLHMFDALGLAVAALDVRRDRRDNAA
jgi:Holliday junction resolvasome RuvABC endonuclease subunit